MALTAETRTSAAAAAATTTLLLLGRIMVLPPPSVSDSRAREPLSTTTPHLRRGDTLPPARAPSRSGATVAKHPDSHGEDEDRATHRSLPERRDRRELEPVLHDAQEQ